MIEHFDDQRHYLAIASQLLRHGGAIVLTTPNLAAAMAVPPERRSQQPIENRLSQEALKILLSDFFTDLKIRTIVQAGGSKGIYRVVNSGRIRRVLEHLRLYGNWRRAMLTAGFGLYLIAVGKKR